MRKILVTVASLAAATVAYAGDWHTAEQLRCSECHTMHYSRTHNFNYTVDGRSTFVGSDATAAGNNGLIYEASVNALCLGCHDGSTTIADVLETSSKAAFVDKRAAGALTEPTSAGDWLPSMGHTLDLAQNPPGWAGTLDATSPAWTVAGLECSDCHSVHGVNKGYRNLGNSHGRVVLADWTTAQPLYTINAALNTDPGTLQPAGTGIDMASDVTELAARDYQASHNRFASASGAYRMDAFCGACHGNFHSDAGVNAAPGPFKRHPTFQGFLSNARLIKNTDRTTWWNDASRLVKPVFKTASTGATNATAGQFSAGCLSCHKGHGNRNSFALISPASAITQDTVDANEEDGNADETAVVAGQPVGVRNLCMQCHSQGRPYNAAGQRQ